VLDDKAIEINYPNRAVGADVGEDWRHPFVAAGEKIEAIADLVTAAIALNRTA